MIDIIIISDAVFKMHIIVNGSKDIFLGYMLGNKLMDIALYSFAKRLGVFRILIKYLPEYRVIYMFCDAQILGVAFHKVCYVNHHVGEHLNVPLLCLDIYGRYRCILDPVRKFNINPGSCLG